MNQGAAIDVVEGVVGREAAVVHQPHDELARTQHGGAGRHGHNDQQKMDDSFHVGKNSCFFVIIRLLLLHRLPCS